MVMLIGVFIEKFKKTKNITDSYYVIIKNCKYKIYIIFLKSIKKFFDNI